jgi:heat shock protein HslJ
MMAAAGFRPLAAALALGGCASIAADARTFEGTRWHIAAINGHPTPRSGRFDMSFAGGQFSAHAGCNSAGGSFRVEGNTLHPGPVRSSRMACDSVHDLPVPLMTFERWGFAVLGQPMRMQWKSGKRLILSNAAGSIALERLP